MRALICGAGIAGLAVAHRLATDGWAVTVVEQSPGPRRQGYMVDFFGPGYDAAERMGLLPRLRGLAYPIGELAYVDDEGRARASTSYERFSRGLSGRLLSLMRPDLELALREALPAGVDVRYGVTVERLDDLDGPVTVTSSDGTLVRADLVVGADGIHSAVRAHLFGPEAQFVRYLGMRTAAWTFADPLLRDELGDRLCLTDSVDRMMGFYGLRNGDVAAFAVHRTPDPARPSDVRTTLWQTYASLGWRVPDALARIPPPDLVYDDVVAQVDVPHWRTGRVVLVGDACQAVSLVAGQGASLAIAGAGVLADRLRAARSIDDGLAAYEREWRPVIARAQASGRAGVEWFLPSSSRRRLLRRALLRATAVPAFDRLAATAFVGKQRRR